MDHNLAYVKLSKINTMYAVKTLYVHCKTNQHKLGFTTTTTTTVLLLLPPPLEIELDMPLQQNLQSPVKFYVTV